MFNPPADARVPGRDVILLWRGNHCRITVRAARPRSNLAILESVRTQYATPVRPAAFVLRKRI
jgi:hypothetical protein